jgi:hypothetical protein
MAAPYFDIFHVVMFLLLANGFLTSKVDSQGQAACTVSIQDLSNHGLNSS